MRLLGPADFADLPWKNGGGRTLQLAVEPPGATYEHFDWKVNIATIARSGPFSRFPGCRRSMLLLDGEGFELDIAGRKVVVKERFVPVSFDGDVPVECRLLGSTSRDFGVISSVGRPDLIVLKLHGPQQVRVAPNEMIAFVEGSPMLAGRPVEAPAVVRVDGARETLALGGTGTAVHVRTGGR